MASAAQLNSSLLAISVIAVLLPAAFHFATNTEADPDEGMDILKMSHGVAIVLLIMCVLAPCVSGYFGLIRVGVVVMLGTCSSSSGLMRISTMRENLLAK